MLQELARLHRVSRSPRVLAITGSNGKTTTKELVHCILSKKYSVLATAGNLNNHIGVPLTLLTLADQEVAVVEMGANHMGEIALLAEIASPELGLVTNVGKAHLEGFGSLEGVLEAKTELYQYLSAHGGKAIIDGTDSRLLNKAAEHGVSTLVVGAGGDIEVGASVLDQDPYLKLDLVIEDRHHELPTRLVGAYNLQNILLAAAVGHYFGIPGGDILDAVGGYIPGNQRSQFIEGRRNRIILDSYNANPTSMREAVNGLLQYASSPTMLILGDMAEMGESSIKEHRDLVRWIAGRGIDRVLLAGSIFNKCAQPTSSAKVFPGMKELESFLRSEQPEGFHILVKGSRIMELEKILPLLDDPE
jgi:UDP-N-acetylmuramoyl-tripeptide--D-alanyl-D-alanine ligase